MVQKDQRPFLSLGKSVPHGDTDHGLRKLVRTQTSCTALSLFILDKVCVITENGNTDDSLYCLKKPLSQVISTFQLLPFVFLKSSSTVLKVSATLVGPSWENGEEAVPASFAALSGA